MSSTEGFYKEPGQEKDYFGEAHRKRERLGLPSLLHLLKYEAFVESDAKMPDELAVQLVGVTEKEREEIILEYLRNKRDYELFDLK